MNSTVFAFFGCAALVLAQSPSVGPDRRLAFNQNHYRLRAGDRVAIDAAPDTADFIRHAKQHAVRINGTPGRGFSFGTNRIGDQVVLAASLRMKPGMYTVAISETSESGEARTATISVTLDPMQPVPTGNLIPPVVLLNGWQLTCPSLGEADTFGNLGLDLQNLDGVPVVYFFDNCAEDEKGLIEDLGTALGEVINLIQYADGAPVPLIDLIAHSMGGLIVRSYLAGVQANGSLAPPANPRVRKFVEIATPNFGSFLALTDPLPDVQSREMIPGSSLLWILATWNQRGDDLRGLDALAIIGNGGYAPLSGFPPAQASDGVVSLTSASLSFARDPSRTLILPYCHTTSNILDLLPDTMDCNGLGIVKAPETASIVTSFLVGTSAWQSVVNAHTPPQDSWLSQYGGLYFVSENAADQWLSLSKVTFGTTVSLTNPTGTAFYNEFLRGTDTFIENNGIYTCGPFTQPAGRYYALRCKFSPQISSVGPLLTGVPGWIVQSGTTISINGVGFGAQLCSTCQVSLYPNIALKVASWSDQLITASLPDFTSTGAIGLTVQTATGSDYITFMIAPLASPVIALAPAVLRFSYTVGGAATASQSVSVSNSGGGTLTWSATPNASWLALTSAPGLLTVSINPAGLSPGMYTGTIAIRGVGASNSPQTVAVTLIVAAATTPTPTISLSAAQANFAYIVGGAVPTTQTISISSSGGGTLSWSASSNASWLSVTPAGTAPSTLTISANPSGLNVGSYNGAITLTATGATNSPQAIVVALTINAAASTITVASVTNAASSSPGAIAPGEIVAIKGSGLGPAAGVSFSVDPSTSMVDTTLAGTQVLFGGIAAAILYTSNGQVNAIVPYEIVGRTQVVMQLQYQGVSSSGTTLLLQVATAAPGLFTFNSTGTGPAAAVNQDGALNGPSNPAAASSYVTLYFTGGGQTSPAGVTGSISGSVLKWLVQGVTVTVGGQPATVAFDGAAPTFIDGFLQLNIGLPSGVHGTVPVVVSVAGNASPATATLAVQ